MSLTHDWTWKEHCRAVEGISCISLMTVEKMWNLCSDTLPHHIRLWLVQNLVHEINMEDQQSSRLVQREQEIQNEVPPKHPVVKTWFSTTGSSETYLSVSTIISNQFSGFGTQFQQLVKQRFQQRN